MAYKTRAILRPFGAAVVVSKVGSVVSPVGSVVGTVGSVVSSVGVVETENSIILHKTMK